MGDVKLEGTITFVEGGHSFILDSRGDFEWDWDGDFHDGPHCIKCGENICVNCDPDYKTQSCSVTQPTLPGLEYS